MKEVSAKMRRKQKFLLVLPLIVIPFVTLAFKALGGGGGDAVQATVAVEGINTKLPDVHVKETDAIDKLSYYSKAAADSVKIQKMMNEDPYYNAPLSFDPYPHEDALMSPYQKHLPAKYGDANEEKVYAKLQQLNEALEQKPSPVKESLLPAAQSSAVPAADVDRLEQLMQQLDHREPDTELQQISSVMDKILDVQYPERMQAKLKDEPPGHEKSFYTVRARSTDDTIVNGFYSTVPDEIQENNNAIAAVVNENQVLQNGSVIKLRLLQDVFIGNTKIPAGAFVFGVASLKGERLVIDIHSIRQQQSIYEVKMQVYDLDGLPGIFIPGAISRTVVKESADKSLQSLGVLSPDPSLQMQAATAGIATAKSLLSKRMKIVKVLVKAGYKVLLKAS